ncbi:MAG: 30S ribosomal protein S16 [Ardenticatenaceae bacterium]
MVKIRLRRTGKKNQPSYRIVVADSRSPRNGRFIETLGHYNPLTNPETVVFDKSKALKWMAHGAQPTDAVKRMLSKAGIYDALPRYHAGENPEAIFASMEAPVPAENTEG